MTKVITISDIYSYYINLLMVTSKQGKYKDSAKLHYQS